MIPYHLTSLPLSFVPLVPKEQSLKTSYFPPPLKNNLFNSRAENLSKIYFSLNMNKSNLETSTDDISDVRSQVASNPSNQFTNTRSFSLQKTNISQTLDLSLSLYNLKGLPTSTSDESSTDHTHSIRMNDHTDPCHKQSKVFSCNFCKRKFFSSQALGGHQNAHKRERSMARRRINTFPYVYPGNIVSLPLHGSVLYSRLGIEAHSLVNQPIRGPAFMEEEGFGLYWPGSYRENLHNERNDMNNDRVLQVEEPDLTLKL